MADKSAIEWTDATWNPIVGCSIVSPGCTHCYAMGMAARIEAMTAALTKTGQCGAPHYNGTTRKVNGNTIWTGKVAMAPEHILLQPLAWRAPRRIFVNSMGDLFHEDVPDEWIDKVFAVMALAPQHTFQVLTKRARRMREYCSDMATQARVAAVVEAMWFDQRGEAYNPGCLKHAGERISPNAELAAWPLPNVWLGVSAERQQEADERVPELLATPAAVRFVSAEPLLGPIDFRKYMWPVHARWPSPHKSPQDAEDNGAKVTYHRQALVWAGSVFLDWIIVGGESGPYARPMHPDWPRAIRDQCKAAGVPFFFKQWGATVPVLATVVEDDGTSRPATDADFPDDPPGSVIDGNLMCRVGKKAAGRLLDGIEHNAFPSNLQPVE